MPRNVSGTYSLPLPPVVANTVIQSAWANTTTDDIAQGITDSLDRNGRGGMIAPFRLVDGSELQPAFAFSSETGTGLWRETPGIMAVSVMGAKVASWSGSEYSVLTDFGVTGNVAVTGDLSFTGNLILTGDIALDGNLGLTGGISVTGGISSTDDISVVENFDGIAGFFSTNLSAGANALSGFRATNDANRNIAMLSTGTGYTALLPGQLDSTGLLFADAARGMAFVATGAAGGQRWYTGTSPVLRMVMDQAGLVAIGDNFNPTTPGVKLDVQGTIRGIGGASASGAGQGLRLLNLAGTHGASLTVGEVSTDLTLSNDTGPVIINNTGANRAWFDINGRFGVGVTPSYGIHLTGSTTNAVIAVTDPAGVTTFMQANSNVDGRVGSLSNHPMYFVANGAVKGEWNPAGNFGFGMTGPVFRVDVSSPTGGYPGIHVDVSGAPNQGMLQLGNNMFLQGGGDYTGLRFNQGGAELGHLSTSGNLGLGVSNPGIRLHLKAAGAGARCRVESSDGSGVIADWLADGSDSAQLGTTSSHPIKLFTAFAIRQIWGAGTNAAIKHVYNTTEYVAGNDPGAVAADIPIGAIVFGQAVISGGSPGLTGLGTFVCGSGGQQISWGGYTGGSTTTITHGTWRNIGAQTAGGVGLFQRVA